MREILCLVVIYFLYMSSAHSAIVYQNFEQNNGTPPSAHAAKGSEAEYGWGFNGAVVELNDAKPFVYSGRYSWKITIPAGEHVHAGGAVPAQLQTYQVNFMPECHDRITFWIWADPSAAGDHTAMIKFFDQGNYKAEGVGVWTIGPARYRQWTQVTILFSQLPKDFNLHRVDKIEFFNYWDGTYYYDDIELGSSHSAESDTQCLKDHQYLSCLSPQDSLLEKIKTSAPDFVLGLSSQESKLCRSVFSPGAQMIYDRRLAHLQTRIRGLELMDAHEPR
ncbi:MAG: hypothetical protein JNN05_03625 [Candidatus Omnitrophica bacterium]|nr:hypothetical protein [Candidatus Omnitrophota bacterium]